MCTNEYKPNEVGVGAEPLAQQGYEPLDERVRRQQAEAHARAASGGIVSNAANSRELGPKCLVAGCSNRFGEGVFHGELCSPCHRMIVTGVVQPQGETFIHSMKRTLAMAAEQRYLDRASILVDARVREWRGAGSELRGAVVGLVVNALKEGEKNAEEGKREGR